MDAEETDENMMERMAVLDFDMLCAAVALQTQGMKTENRREKEEADEEPREGELGGVQRMWEGDVIGCLEDRRIAIEASCCPCYRFGRNMGRASLGSCFLQGTVYFSLVALLLLNLIAFGITERYYFLYLGAAFVVSFGLYAGYFRSKIRRQFNIRGSGSYFQDCITHLLCPCCTLCQESRTLEINNVQDGVWHGRGDTVCIGSHGEGSKEFNVLHKSSLMPTKTLEPCNMERPSNGSSNHSWNVGVTSSEPLMLPNRSDLDPKH
ncbi:Protein plant cadmium resistance 8 [Apostasia shenzhenica]|uniref:Protein plant cadmium resistance 8 n=1 Tax=Apostasia shenzhenica TaxID=1088818 RepID=A0A2H9ZX96_9ASPA|nr:Protein plant cadmium resistance 8 [Apostasia shenzhenica]